MFTFNNVCFDIIIIAILLKNVSVKEIMHIFFSS